MSESGEVADLYAAIEKTARLMEVPCSREKVLPILSAYSDGIPQAVIAFRVATGARGGEFNCHFMMLPKQTDPYQIAVAAGLTPKTDHPVGALIGDIEKHCPVDSYGVDFAIGGGFKKTWTIFPGDDLQKLSRLAEIPSMPASLAANLAFFTRHGLDDKVSLIGMDYANKTANLYFGRLPEGLLDPENVKSILRELDLPEASEQMLRLAREAFGVYATLRWDTAKIERFCFSVMTPDPLSLPVQLDPVIEKFVRVVPYDAAQVKLFYAAVSRREGEFYKIQSYYQWRDRTLSIMQLRD
jgi:hypothetical protein